MPRVARLRLPLASTLLAASGCTLPAAQLSPAESARTTPAAATAVSPAPSPALSMERLPPVAEPVPAPSAPGGQLSSPTSQLSPQATQPDRSASQLHPIDLPTALQLADAGNFQIALAREQIRQSWAQVKAAQALWLPSIRPGTNWNKHDGEIQATDGTVSQVSRTAFYTGLGANSQPAASPTVPGIYANFSVADALFKPLAAKQLAAARGHAAVAVTNDTLLRVSLAYLELLRAAQDLAIARQTQENARQLADLTRAYADVGQGQRSDADRAATEFAIRRSDTLRSQEAVVVASARLAQLLHMDPTVALEPIDPVVAPIELVPVEAPVGELVAQGLGARPELAESQSLVAQAVQIMRRERYAIFMPSVIMGISYGGFGGGQGDTIGNFSNRMDADAIAYWELRNLGFGEAAARAQSRSLVQQATINRLATMDQVAREVVEAHAQVTARQAQIAIAREAVAAAIASRGLNNQRIEQAKGLPIEVLQSNQALAQAQREYLRTVVDYNVAQFSLYRALGWPKSLAGLPAATSAVPPTTG